MIALTLHENIQNWSQLLRDEFGFHELREVYPNTGRDALRRAVNDLVEWGALRKINRGRSGLVYVATVFRTVN